MTEEKTIEICTDCGYRLHYSGDERISFIHCSNEDCDMVVTDYFDDSPNNSDWSKVKTIKEKDYKLD